MGGTIIYGFYLINIYPMGDENIVEVETEEKELSLLERDEVVLYDVSLIWSNGDDSISLKAADKAGMMNIIADIRAEHGEDVEIHVVKHVVAKSWEAYDKLMKA